MQPVAPVPRGFAGWLALVALQSATAAAFSFVEVFRIAPGLWSPRFANFLPIAIAALLIAVVSAGLSAWALILMVRKSRRFPSTYIVSLLWRVGKNLFELWAVSKIAPEFPSNVVPLTWSIIFAPILVPYVLRSKRVHNTFIQDTAYRSSLVGSVIRFLGVPYFIGFFLALSLVGSAACGWASCTTPRSRRRRL
jgi:hypothetical protein